MVNLIGIINAIPIYEDNHMKENEILKGRKQGTGITFLIANPKTANLIYKTLLNKERKDKLNYLNNL